MARTSVASPRGIAAAAGVLVLLAGTLAGLFGWQTFLGVYAGMFLLIPLAACTAWGVLKLWEAGSRLATDGETVERQADCEEEPLDPLSVLRGQYAAGELDETEFETRVETLLRTADAGGTGFESAVDTTFTDGTETEPVRRARSPTNDD